MAVALIALFVSLGGVSYAVATNSIDSREIENNSVRTKDLRNNDVRGRDVRNNSLTGFDVDESHLGKVPSARRADLPDARTRRAAPTRRAGRIRPAMPTP